MKEYDRSSLNRVKRGQNRAIYDKEIINKILDDGFVCYVAYNYDGRAITIPMAYGRDGDTIYLHGSTGNRMLLSLLEQKEISLTVMHLDGLVLARSGLHHSVNYRSVSVFGSLEKIEDDTQKEAGLKCVVDHMMKGRWDGIRPMHQKELDRTLVTAMKIDTASAKVRDVGVQDEPEDYNLDVWAGLVPIRQIAEYPVSDEQLKDGIEIPQHVLDYYEANKV